MLRNKCFCNELPMMYPNAQEPAAMYPNAQEPAAMYPNAQEPAAFIPMAPGCNMPMEMAPYQMMPVMPAKIELAEAYVPYQYYCNSYQPEEALHKGTMFPELYRPYAKTK